LLEIVCEDAELPIPIPAIVQAAEIKDQGFDGVELGGSAGGGKLPALNAGEIQTQTKSDLACKLCHSPESDALECDFAVSGQADIFPAVEDGEEDIPNDSILLASDPTLMAFTQLGAYRTNCQRSFISLMDDKKQYIIAEATRSVSLNDPNEYDRTDPGEKVYLGARILDQQWGVCPNTIQVFTALDNSLDISTDVVTANNTCYVMNDLSAIPVYANRPYVMGWPYMRFYAEVPIHSP